MPAPETSRTWRHWARRLLPPLLVDTVRPPAAPRSRVTWRGVYATRADVPAHRDVYEGELVDDMVTHTRAAYQRSDDAVPLWHESFVLVAGMVAVARQELYVVDFGGGVGSAFSQLVASLPPQTAIRYLVVETPQVCEAGRRLFIDDPRIGFATELPIGGDTPDIVYANGVLQYLDDYADALCRLASLKAPHVLLSRLYAWDGARFATAQVNLQGRTFASWFVNVDEVTALLAERGYAVACDVIPEKRYQSELPATHRVDRLRTMLFARSRLTSSS
jgi:putative methyltransferase (TIGR04325 family)